jgi:hypothetical protein
MQTPTPQGPRRYLDVGMTYVNMPEVKLGAVIITGCYSGDAERYPLTIGIVDEEDGA